MPLVVGFSAQYLSGKDLCSNYLCDTLNKSNILRKWKRASFASKVKKILAENFDVSLDFIEEWKVKDYAPPGFDVPIRVGLTNIGTGWREIKSDIWIEKLFKNNKDNLVISDLRFLNESNAVRGKSDLPYMKGHDGISILLYRPGFENNFPSKSEQEIMPFVNMMKNKSSGVINDADFPFDIWLRNNGTQEDMFRKIDNIVIPYLMMNTFGVDL